MAWKILLCILFGYLIGSINPSYIVARLKGFDIRKKGSGNAGASNALITMGKKVGILMALLDIAKATACYLLAPLIFRDVALAAELAGVACMLGHMFPIYMGFKGGKGLACLGGVLLGIDWRLFLLLLAAEILLCVWVDYICIVPITASILIPILYGLFGAKGPAPWLLFANNGWTGAAVLFVATAAILYRHIQNIHRISYGGEMHLSYMWSKDKEAEKRRVQENTERHNQKVMEKKQAKEAAK
jgi:glycerol-3-phosphate acyltransferase PlsY